MKFLIVDDDEHILRSIAIGLQLQWQDSAVATVADGEAGLRAFFEADPDVVLLDLAMPGKGGLEVLKEIRRVSDVPVIILSARGEEVDQVQALEMGADDYLVKPFGHLALIARIRAVLRRAELPPPARALPDFVAGELTINFAERRVTVGDTRVHLTPVEYRLLYHLARNAGRVVPYRVLLQRALGEEGEAEGSANYLKSFVSRLRAKIEAPAGHRYIETERGLGYRFVRP